MDRWFDPRRIVYDDGTFSGKPAPDIYLRAAERIGLSPSRCIVAEDALYEALRGKVISGAIIDAYSQEPLTASPLFSLDNVILSPHAGAFTTDALNAMSRMSVDQLFQYVDGATPDNLVTAE